MKYLLAATAAVALLAGASQAEAVVCGAPPILVSNGGNVSAATLLGGACVAAGDKIFGEFSSSGAITGTGSASFSFLTTPGNVTIGFLGTVGPNSVGTINYNVAVNPANSEGFLINDLQKDFTLNASLTSLPAAATLTGGVTAPFVVAFNCNRTVNPSGGSCPETHIFSPVSQISVAETLTTGPNAIVTALTDTISQVPPVVEPTSLALLGTGLVVMGFASRWSRRRRDTEHCATA